MRSRALVTAVLAGLLAGFVPHAASAHGQVGPRSATAHAAVPVARSAIAWTVVARYGFDGARGGLIADESGNGHTLKLLTGNGGSVSMVRHGDGRALRFPAKCAVRKKCPHAA